MNITRKEFCSGLVGGSVLLLLQSCGGGGSSYSNGPGFGAGCSANTITANHGHSLNVPAADLSSMSSKTYSIQGTAGHDHSVTLTAQNLADLKNGMTVTVASTSTDVAPFGPHTHTVTIAC